MKTYLPDANVWIALAFRDHLHHSNAAAWLEPIESETICFCRTTQQGFLRVATNPKAMGPSAATLPDAWGAYDEIISDSRIQFSNEPDNLEQCWRGLTDDHAYSPRIWTDAYLAAFAIAADFHFVTLDSGFARYRGLTFTHLE